MVLLYHHSAPEKQGSEGLSLIGTPGWRKHKMHMMLCQSKSFYKEPSFFAIRRRRAVGKKTVKSTTQERNKYKAVDHYMLFKVACGTVLLWNWQRVRFVYIPVPSWTTS